jgi:hypothetical protein
MQIYKYVIKISKFADMKKITFLFLLSSILFSSCETDFTVNADWKEVTVVYGLLDQSQDKQYIRINKAFLGNEDAYVMASVADSINYNPDNLEVKIEKLSASGTVLDTKIITDTIHVKKEDGIFATDENIIYVFDTDNFLNEEKEYKLTITNLVSGDTINSETKLIHNLTFITTFNHSFGFISNASGDSSYYSSKTISWNHSKNAAIYQMTLIVNYSEESNGIVTSKQVKKVYPLIDDDGANLSQKITGEELFSLLANNVLPSSTVTREVVNLDLLFSVGTADLNTYIRLNEPPTGIVQERDLYTNIDGGIGLFSARNSTLKDNIEITDDTKRAIADSLQHLNFINP